MHQEQRAYRLTRRMLLLGSAATLAGLPELAWAQGQVQSPRLSARIGLWPLIRKV